MFLHIHPLAYHYLPWCMYNSGNEERNFFLNICHRKNEVFLNHFQSTFVVLKRFAIPGLVLSHLLNRFRISAVQTKHTTNSKPWKLRSNNVFIDRSKMHLQTSPVGLWKMSKNHLQHKLHPVCQTPARIPLPSCRCLAGCRLRKTYRNLAGNFQIFNRIT